MSNSFLEILRQFLIDNGVTAQIFINYTPPKPDFCVTLREYEGRVPDSGMNKYDKPSVNISARALSHQQARSVMVQIYNLIHDAPNMLNTPFIDIRAVQSPYFAGQDEQDRYVFVQNYHTEIERSAA
jgi:hypothetical protein